MGRAQHTCLHRPPSRPAQLSPEHTGPGLKALCIRSRFISDLKPAFLTQPILLCRLKDLIKPSPENKIAVRIPGCVYMAPNSYLKTKKGDLCPETPMWDILQTQTRTQPSLLYGGDKTCKQAAHSDLLKPRNERCLALQTIIVKCIIALRAAQMML